MNKKFLLTTPLFQGCNEESLELIAQNSNFTIKKYHKDSIILSEGDLIKAFGLILEGTVQIENIDILGNKSILGLAHKGDVFAEAYACIPNQRIMVDVVAVEECEVLFINLQNIIGSRNPSQIEGKIIANLLKISSKKNQMLSRRIFHSSPKKIRDRLLSYFSDQVKSQGKRNITIPLNRQQFADYLGVERTALSKELGKMRNEGLIEFHKNNFTIYIE